MASVAFAAALACSRTALDGEDYAASARGTAGTAGAAGTAATTTTDSGIAPDSGPVIARDSGAPDAPCSPNCGGALCGASDGCGSVCTTCVGIRPIVLFGGNTKIPGELDDAWRFDGASWTEISGAAPPVKTSVALSPQGAQLVLLGDATGARTLDDTWTFDGAHWLPIEGAAPHPTNRVNAVLTPFAGDALLFGGFALGYLGDTWRFDGKSWSSVPASGPPARSGHALANLNGKVILFGGFDGVHHLNDTWAFDGMTWTAIVTAGPSARSALSLAPLGDKLVLFGGSDGHNNFDDTWTFDGNSWQQLDISGPSARDAQAMATQGQRIILFGGQDITSDLGDTWAFDGVHWTELAPSVAPSARHYTTMATLP